MKNLHVIGKELFITSDEEIKKDEFYLGDDNHIYNLCTTVNSNGKKIILTTNADYIEEGIQSIDDEFLEWFVENPGCEFVHAYNDRVVGYEYDNYTIIIPKEETKQESVFETAKVVLRKYLLENKERVTSDLEEMRERSNGDKQETLEEVAKGYSERHQDVSGNLGKYLVSAVFQDGAKYQAERMYSEEDMKKAFQSSSHTNMLDIYNSFEDFIEQFKKK